MKRVAVERRPDKTDDAAIVARFASAPQMLCIVNTRAHARAVRQAKGRSWLCGRRATPDDAHVPVHRREPAGNANRAKDICLITGVPALPRRLHPAIKGVPGAQVAGASLVSFNLDAEQGANAPTSEAAAERYGAALNAMLASGERNRLRRGIGDASVVFWADASGAEDAAAAAEDVFAQMFAPPNTNGDGEEAVRLGDTLKALAEGRPAPVAPRLSAGVRFHVFGPSPNAARLSVRFWLSDSFDAFARHLLAYAHDIRIEPPPRGWPGKKRPREIWRLLVKTAALQEKFENVPPALAGELARAILGGQPFPRTWLLACITRLRVGDDPASGWHAAAIKAWLNRNRRPAMTRPAALSQRHEFVLYLDVTDANPNGDPDARNMPRLDPETGEGLVSDVCLKRKIRNFVELAKEDAPGFRIYVTEGAILNEKHRKAYVAHPEAAATGDVKKAAKLTPKSDEAAVQVRRFMGDNFRRAHVRGRDVDRHQCRPGPRPRANRLRSLRGPVLPLEISITHMAATNQAEKKQRTEGANVEEK